MRALLIALVALPAFAQKPAHTLTGLEFRDAAVAFTCQTKGEALTDYLSDADGTSSESMGFDVLLRKSTGPHLAQKPKAARANARGETIDIAIVQSQGKWNGDRFEWVANPREPGAYPTSIARYFLVKGKTRRQIGSFIAQGLRGTITPYWSDDGERVALGLEDFEGDTAKNDVCLVWAPTRGISIEFSSTLHYDSAIGREAWVRMVAHEEHVVGRLKAAGFPVFEYSQAKKTRENSVAYLPASLPESEVTRLKESVGVSITVEPLTWKPKSDGVFVMGTKDTQN